MALGDQLSDQTIVSEFLAWHKSGWNGISDRLVKARGFYNQLICAISADWSIEWLAGRF